MATGNNPAGRLYRFLSEGSTHPPNMNQAEACRRILGIEDQNPFVLLERLAPILTLPSEIRTSVGSLGDLVNAGLLLRWTPAVERSFFSLHLSSTWEHFLRGLGPDTLLSLEFCSDQIDRLLPEPAVSEDDIKTILDQTRQLQEEVLAAALEPDLKAFLLKHLHQLDIVIQDYRFRGPGALKDVAIHAVVNAATDANIRAKSVGNDLARRCWRVFNRVLTLVTFTANTLQIATGVQTLLLDAHDSVPTEIPESVGDAISDDVSRV